MRLNRIETAEKAYEEVATNVEHTISDSKEIKKRTLQELNLEDDFLFSRVMADEEVCRLLLEKLLGITISKIVISEEQKTINLMFDGKGIRFDVYLKDDKGTVYEVEMQKGKEIHLPKRTRYYQGNMDLDLVAKGASYDDLPKSFVIFICTFDYFKKGRHLYTFEKQCVEDHNIKLNDETQVLILNTKGTMNDVDDEMLEFLRYVERSTDEIAEASKGTLVKNIHDRVKDVKCNKAMGVQYMTFEEKLQESERRGLERGIETKAIEAAKNLKKAGVDIETIAKCVGLPAEEVEKL